MLPEFKKRIDTLRQILVGAVPSPQGQIEQITYALIYKFMSDIDDHSASVGGKRTYFTDEYEKYGWHELLAPTLGAHEQLTLYREALGSLAKNPNLPPLFQDIFQNAFLPFNDPRVLRLFLKEIDNFKHSNSDDIGDAYEYLLQITGAQGDVGQFRTPRHIIKFIVEAVNPTKDDKILDPAVGTAGFLIAAYNHVRHHHDGVDEITGLPDEKEKRLSADDKKKLNKNYRGFDVDPTMVRTAKVNMYLHGFTTPDIKNHDSLSSEEYWDKHYDVILANPPFMSPKGGISPHNKFGLKANRAEVLFVDYIASHLKPTGRAGIIVPEGIIFQSGKAYKDLRKNLVENSLYAVVSLPAGVFQPYSGVKTSVLLLDKELAKRRKDILFAKIENDGYSTSTQRRETTGNQFPDALKLIAQFREGTLLNSKLAHSVSVKEIAKNGDYNLSGDRYKSNIDASNIIWPLVELGDEKYFKIESGGTPDSKKEQYWNGDINWATLVDLPASNIVTSLRSTQRKISKTGLSSSSAKLLPEGTVLVSSRATIGRVAIARAPIATNQGFKNIVIKDTSAVTPEFVAYIMTSRVNELKMLATGGTFAEFSKSAFTKVKIPLPPIEIQRDIVAELDGYQKIIDAAQTIVKTYKPHLKIKSEWKLVKIGERIKIERGASPRPIEKFMTPVGENWIMIGDTKNVTKYITSTARKVDKEGAAKSRKVVPGDFILSNSMSFGRPYIMKTTGYIHDGWLVLRTSSQNDIDQDFLYYILRTEYVQSQFEASATGGVVRNLNSDLVRNTSIPLPSLGEQRTIVARLEAEQSLIDANKKLIEIYQQKIKDKISEVWGE